MRGEALALDNGRPIGAALDFWRDGEEQLVYQARLDEPGVGARAAQADQPLHAPIVPERGEYLVRVQRNAVGCPDPDHLDPLVKRRSLAATDSPRHDSSQVSPVRAEERSVQGHLAAPAHDGPQRPGAQAPPRPLPLGRGRDLGIAQPVRSDRAGATENRIGLQVDPLHERVVNVAADQRCRPGAPDDHLAVEGRDHVHRHVGAVGAPRGGPAQIGIDRAEGDGAGRTGSHLVEQAINLRRRIHCRGQSATTGLAGIPAPRCGGRAIGGTRLRSELCRYALL